MKRLLLLRHGEAEPAEAASDFDRPLTPHGRHQALQAAQRLRQAHLIPDSVLASPALRARETATIVAARLERLQGMHLEPACYPGPATALLQVLKALPVEPSSLLLVGHNPGLSDLARHLKALPKRDLATGELCCIELSASSWTQIDSGSTSVTRLG
ncbi:MAG TPA: histidine phosphatase family protein [Steroidobacteraceae bacterium]|nr:histidine phosphatase family protein [Steroidobacteraceae bacterium]